jgi:hypothetical protein
MVLELLGSPVDLPTARRAAPSADYGAQRAVRDVATVAQPAKIDNDLYMRLLEVHPLLQVRRGLAASTTRTRLRSPSPDAASRRVSTEFDVTPSRVGVRLLRQLHRRQTSTGAHADKRVQPAPAGTWDESTQSEVDTVCPYCGVGCNLTLHVQDDAIVKVTSPDDHDVTRGNLCIKGRFGYEFVQNRK